MDTQTKKLIFALLFFQRDSEVPLSLFKAALKFLKQKTSDLEVYQLLQEFNFEDYGLQVSLKEHTVSTKVAPSTLRIIKQLQRNEQNKFLNTAKMEVLALVAYKQPVSRKFINQVRGRNSDLILQWLLQNNFVDRVSGEHKKQNLFVTTEKFKEYFQISSLEELPKTTPFSSLDSSQGKSGDS